jgi:hypothetical protein
MKKATGLIASAILSVASSPALALSLSHIGTTEGGKSSGSPRGDGFFYDTFDFVVDKNGPYDLHLVALDPGKDLFLYLLAGGSDSTEASQTIIGANDDSGGNLNPWLQQELATNVKYKAVLTSYRAGETSRYLFNVNGPVPEPATWAMMIVGFALVGAALRFRRGATKVRFAA